MLILVFYSIPESIILITLSSSLYGYDVKVNVKRILLLSISLAITTELVRALPIKYGINILIQIPIFVLMTAYYLKVTVKRSFIIILTGFVILNLAESAFIPIVQSITGKELGYLFENIWSRLITSWGLLLILLMPTVIIIKKKVSLTSAIQFFKTTSLDTKITLMVFIVLIQALLAGVLQLSYIYSESSTWPIVFKGVILQRVIGLALITIPIVSIFLLKRLFTLSHQEAITASQEAYIATVNDLFLAIKGQKHDFINHIQVITGLLQLGKNEEALRYGLQLGQESRETGEILNIKDPTIAALIKSKISTCIVKQIRFKTNIDADTSKLAVKPYDLVRILGNLLDNAIDAVSGQKEDLRRVYFNIRQEHDSIVFEVTNLSPVILPDVIPHIFNDGFTTKEQGHSGTGLAVVKQLVSQYKGRIEAFSNDEDGTTFTVTLPYKN